MECCNIPHLHLFFISNRSFILLVYSFLFPSQNTMKQSSVMSRRPPKHLSLAKKDMVKDQLMEGKSTRKVARNLGVSIGTSVNIRKEIKENIPSSKPGPLPKISERTMRLVARNYHAGELKTLHDAQQFIQQRDGVHVQIETVRTNLRKRRVKAFVEQKRPNLLPHHIHERYQFAKAHKDWTVEEWKKVMFSDESMVSRVGSFGRHYYYSDPEHKKYMPHQVQRTSQGGGGKMMIWGCITYNRPGDLSWIKGGMNAEMYLEVLQDYVVQSFEWGGMNPVESIFQQDNSRVHMANIVKRWFSEQEFTVVKWPANSPDLNIIEHVWALLKHRLNQYEVEPKDLNELWERVQYEWENLQPEFIQGLYESMPRRIKAVLRSKGGLTKY